MSRSSAALATDPRKYVFQGRTVSFPVEVREAASAVATYLVDATAARRLVPRHLEVVEVFPGKALFSIACIDYLDNDLGDYDEVSLAFFVRPSGSSSSWLPYVGGALDFLRGKLATYIYALPVNQSFTCEAGSGIWGFPKTMQRIDFQDGRGQRTCRLYMDDRHVLTLSLPRGGTRTFAETEMETYTVIDDVLHRTRFTQAAEGVGYGVGGGHLVLGDHPIAQELHDLGLPDGGLLHMWMEHQRGIFLAPEPVT